MLRDYLKEKGILWEAIKYYGDRFYETDNTHYGKTHDMYVKKYLDLTGMTFKEKLFYKKRES